MHVNTAHLIALLVKTQSGVILSALHQQTKPHEESHDDASAVREVIQVRHQTQHHVHDYNGTS